jgi:hypothetical protein
VAFESTDQWQECRTTPDLQRLDSSPSLPVAELLIGGKSKTQKRGTCAAHHSNNPANVGVTQLNGQIPPGSTQSSPSRQRIGFPEIRETRAVAQSKDFSMARPTPTIPRAYQAFPRHGLSAHRLRNIIERRQPHLTPTAPPAVQSKLVCPPHEPFTDLRRLDLAADKASYSLPSRGSKPAPSIGPCLFHRIGLTLRSLPDIQALGKRGLVKPAQASGTFGHASRH